MGWQTLIPAEELALIYHTNKCIVVDCRFALAEPEQGFEHYLQAHIPGARYAHLDNHLSSAISETSGRHPLPDFSFFLTFLSEWGITPETQVVAYDDMYGFYASRLWWLLRTLGHQKVAVLNGGLQAWSTAGFSMNDEVPKKCNTIYAANPDKSLWCDTETLQQGLRDDDVLLIDARAEERFNGTTEPIDTIAGHIPGAVNLPITDNLDNSGKLLSPDLIRKRYKSVLQRRSPSDVIHMCGSGVFACHAILAMESAGLFGSMLYPGSWSEWIRDPKRVVARRVR